MKNWKEKDLQSPPLYLQTSPPYDSLNKAYASTPHKKGREHLDLVKIKWNFQGPTSQDEAQETTLKESLYTNRLLNWESTTNLIASRMANNSYSLKPLIPILLENINKTSPL